MAPLYWDGSWCCVLATEIGTPTIAHGAPAIGLREPTVALAGRCEATVALAGRCEAPIALGAPTVTTREPTVALARRCEAAIALARRREAAIALAGRREAAVAEVGRRGGSVDGHRRATRTTGRDIATCSWHAAISRLPARARGSARVATGCRGSTCTLTASCRLGPA